MLYNEESAIPVFKTGLIIPGSHVAFLPVNNSDCSFLTKFSPLRLFLDDLIMAVKTRGPVSRQYSYQQFPNEDYYVDTRLQVGLTAV